MSERDPIVEEPILSVTFKGKPKDVSSKTMNNSALPFAVGGAILGLMMAGAGI